MANFMRKLSISVKPKRTDGEASTPDATPGSPTVGANGPAERGSISDEHVASLSRRTDAVDRVHSPHKSKFPFKSAGRELVSKLSISEAPGSGTPKNRDGEDMSKNQLRKHEKRQAVEHKADWHDKQSADLKQRREEQARIVEREDPPLMRQRYGWLPVNNYGGDEGHTEPSLSDLNSLSAKDIGSKVFFRSRVHNYRKMSAKLAFFLLRQQTTTIQGVLQESDTVSTHMVRWAEHIPIESIVRISGTLQAPKAKEGEVTGALIHDVEVMVDEMHIVSKLSAHLPFSIQEAETTQAQADAENSTRHRVSDRARLQSRILDLRTSTSQAIFRVQSGVCGFFRSYLDTQGFTEIHSPKLQGGATESGASVFKVGYFGRTAFLAQSPQLAKQMSIAADFGRVYEIGAVFRAENSNTHRHLTEYTGLDLEMAIDEHYHEALRMVDRTLKSIFKGVYDHHRHEVELIKTQFPSEDLVWLNETPVLAFRDAIQILNETGWTSDEGQPLPLDEDLGTRDEIQLGKVIKEKFKTDYYIVDKFPASARPFYTMPDPKDPAYTNSFDVFVRGQEIISGGERIHDAQLLADQMRRVNVDPASLEEYMQAFEWGAPPHAGAGVGLERLVMLMLQLGDIRHASLFPRDPKSLPAKAPVISLRHPDASTLHPPWEGQDRTTAHRELQALEKLIANYGDASNTSWLEEKFVIWRDGETGAAIGYVPHRGYAITIGNPLCHEGQFAKIIAAYLEFLRRKTELKPLWLLCGSKIGDVLADKFDWRTFSCAAEQRINLSAGSKAFENADVQRKIRHAQKEGIKIKDIELGSPVPQDIREACDERIKDWLGNRKAHQHVHLTDVHPWQDMRHRQYHYAVMADGKIACLVVLAQLAPEYGWQVKFGLDFPGSTSGAIEAVIVHALKSVQSTGANTATFGGGASNELIPGHNLKGTKIKMLSRAYHTIATDLKLNRKSEFRDKLGAFEDPIFVCYPPKGLGPMGIRAILTFFED
ncbi:MAG: hypothetical protein M1828_006279 [Chrysothrix sp. TS-e1954]|nr:MAG: hypothetical protein M1828_006279 [Chrysothrix sp. TS-e1954]